jgi:DNA-directed RNA polymerase specialized sigma24 family protein
MTDSNESDFDRQLREIAEQAQRSPVRSLDRQRALTSLISKIFDRLSHPQRGNWQSSLYEDFYNEARQNTLMYICQKIDNYRPERPVMAWANFILNKELYKAIGEWMKSSSPEEIPEIPYEDRPSDQTSQSLREFVRNDPEGLLQAETLREHPNVTFQFLILETLSDKTLSAIARDLGIEIPTLFSFFKRRSKKLKSYFEKYLKSDKENYFNE